MVHATYQAGGLDGKIARFREGGIWMLDNSTYFSEPLLTYQNNVKVTDFSSCEPATQMGRCNWGLKTG